MIFHGDCVKVLEEDFYENSIDLVVTSPPYDDLRTYGGHKFYYEHVIFALYRVIRPGGVVVWVVGDSVEKGSETGTAFKQALFFKGTGFLLHDTMIFEKNTASFPAQRKSKRYTQIFEYMFVFSKDTPPRRHNLICDKENKWAGHTNWGQQTKRGKDGVLKNTSDINPVPKKSPRNNIWRYNVSGFFGHKDKKAYEHPATFPEALATDHILTWSNKGDVVLDPMCGSGTTLVAAKKLGREFTGIDIDATYCKLARSRLK